MNKIDINTISNKPGVYLMKNQEGKVIYVGKAKQLKKRIGSYYNNKNHPIWTKVMISSINDIETMVTKNELEAIFLENNLIKLYKPHFNIRMRDDKTYPFIKITAEKYPRILIVRKIYNDKAKYFGPYLSAYELKEVLKLIQKTYGIVTHRYREGQRACLSYQLGLCAAPYAGKISRKEYMENVAEATDLLQGKYHDIVKVLKHKMQKTAMQMEYEKAEKYKKQIISLQRLIEKQDVVKIGKDNYDIWAIEEIYGMAIALLIKMREGKIIQSKEFIFDILTNDSKEDILETALQNYYLSQNDIPRTIILDRKIENENIILAGFKNRDINVQFIVPKQGEKHHLVMLAKINAIDKLQREIAKKNIPRELLHLLKKDISLNNLPDRIEAFDISNIGKNEAVGAMVVFEQGLPKTSDYRKFRIKTINGQNDVGMLAEIVKRRFANKELRRPDLLLIDGGIGQLSAVKNVLEECKIKNIEVISIAKKFEIIYKVGLNRPIILDRQSKSLLLVQRIRDEAHRFAITFHRYRRDKL